MPERDGYIQWLNVGQQAVPYNPCPILTFRENLPLAGFTAWRVRELLIKLIKQFLHLTPSFTLRELVADPEFWSPTVVPCTPGGCGLDRLQTSD